MSPAVAFKCDSVSTHQMTPWAPVDRPRHTRGRLGFVLLSNEETADDDMRFVAPRDVGIFVTRVKIADPVSLATLGDVANELTRCAQVLPADLDAIAYVCTSGSVVVGEDEVARLLSLAQPAAKTISLVTCATDALRALGLKRISLATPYIDEVNRAEVAFLEDRGFSVVKMTGLGIGNGRDMCMVEPRRIVDLALESDTADAEGIFVSCTALRTIEVVEEIERIAGKPVVGSNQALIWRMLRLIGVEDQMDGLGRLFRDC